MTNFNISIPGHNGNKPIAEATSSELVDLVTQAQDVLADRAKATTNAAFSSGKGDHDFADAVDVEHPIAVDLYVAATDTLLEIVIGDRPVTTAVEWAAIQFVINYFGSSAFEWLAKNSIT